MGMTYIDVTARDRLIDTMLRDAAITKKDLQVAFFLGSGGKTRKEIGIALFGGADHSPEKAYSNRASVTRSLKRLAPYLEKPKSPNRKKADKNHQFDNEYGEYIGSIKDYVFTLKAGLTE